MVLCPWCANYGGMGMAYIKDASSKVDIARFLLQCTMIRCDFTLDRYLHSRWKMTSKLRWACQHQKYFWSTRVSTTPGNPGNLLEFTGPPGNCCVRWSTALVSGHKTGYQIAYLSRNWSPYFIFATAPCRIKCISCFCSIFRQTTSTG